MGHQSGIDEFKQSPFFKKIDWEHIRYGWREKCTQCQRGSIVYCGLRGRTMCESHEGGATLYHNHDGCVLVDVVCAWRVRCKV